MSEQTKYHWWPPNGRLTGTRVKVWSTFGGKRTRSPATALAEAGASTQEIMAITGHQTEQMVKVYTKRVEQKRLAGSAIRKLDSNRDNK